MTGLLLRTLNTPFFFGYFLNLILAAPSLTETSWRVVEIHMLVSRALDEVQGLS